MAILYTPIQDLPYPDANSKINSTDEYIRNLAFALEGRLVMVFASATERTSDLVTAAEGQLSWLQDVNTLSVYNGSAWKQIYPPSPNILNGSGAPSSGLGNAGDVYVEITP